MGGFRVIYSTSVSIRCFAPPSTSSVESCRDGPDMQIPLRERDPDPGLPELFVDRLMEITHDLAEVLQLGPDEQAEVERALPEADHLCRWLRRVQHLGVGDRPRS